MRINCIPVTKHQFAALNVAYTQQHYEFQLLSAGRASFAFPKYFLSKVFSSETQHWSVGGSGILAGCCMIQCFLLFSCITVCRREERVMEKSQRQRCHCKLACMTVPGSNCKAFLALLFSFFLFFFCHSACLSLSQKRKYCRIRTNPWRPFLIFIFYFSFHTTDVNFQMHGPSLWVAQSNLKLDCSDIFEKHQDTKHPVLHYWVTH